MSTGHGESLGDGIVSLIFTVRNLIHENAALKGERKTSLFQLITLKFISRERPTMKEIADYLAIAAPSATSLVNTLIEDGVVRREEEKDDRRRVRILITAKGRERLKNEMESASRRIKGSLAALSVKEQEELAKILGKVSDHLRDTL